MPFHSASAFRIGIKPIVRFASAGFGGLNFDRLFALLRSVTAIDREGLSGNKRRADGTEPHHSPGNLFQLLIRPWAARIPTAVISSDS
jgi:hypothetical protein